MTALFLLPETGIDLLSLCLGCSVGMVILTLVLLGISLCQMAAKGKEQEEPR